MSRASSRVRYAILGIIALFVVVSVTARIWWVNVSLPRIPLEYYNEGEWVALEGAFQSDSSEQTQGYSLMVEDAEVMTYDEYLKRQGGGPQEPSSFGDARCVVDVSVRIKNDGGEEGGIYVFQMVLVPERANEYLICDVMGSNALWPQVQEGASSGVRVRPGTEFLTHIPYVFNGGEEVYGREVEDRTFTLLVSRMPVRKMIVVTAEG